MRRFGLGMLFTVSLLVGCEKPVEPGGDVPGPSGSGVTDSAPPKVEMGAEDKGAKEEPKADAPKTDAPPADAPKTDAPKADAPAADAPKADAPKADAPAADAPKADAPKTDAPPPVEQPAPPADAPKSADAGSTAAKFVSTKLKVPTMSCPHGCWPTVKETLAKQPNVESVELTKQAVADAIDNPVVIVKFNGKFDSEAAIQALAKAGFEKAELVN